MKQGKLYTTIILWVFLAAVVCYFAYYIFSAVYAPLTTAIAIEYETGSGSYTTGFVVRPETVVRARNNIATLVVAEGKRVSKDQTVATGYLSDDAQTRQAEIDSLESQLKQLEYAYSYSNSVSDQAELDLEIQSRLQEMARYVAHRDMNTAADSAAALKGLVLRRMSTDAAADEAMGQRITELQQELDALQHGSQSDTLVVPAPVSGYFSGTVDGYERVLTVDLLETMTLSDFYALEPDEPAAEEIGKIITGDTWYYVTTIPEAQAEGAYVGKSIPVTFASAFYDGLTMKIHRIDPPEDGVCLLILSCERYMQEVTLLREQSADVVFSSYSGLRVPKEAVRVLDQVAGVFVLESNTAVWKPVKILCDTGESYVVEMDKSSTDNLWPGDEIIVNGKDLYDGKVVR